MSQLLVQDREGASPRRREFRLGLHRGHGIGEHADGVVKSALGLVNRRFVIDHFQIARGALLGKQDVLLGFIELFQLAVNLGQPQIVIGILGIHSHETLILFERFRIFLFVQKRLCESPAVGDLAGLSFGGLPVGIFGIGQIVGLRIRVAIKIPKARCSRAIQDILQYGNGFLRFPFIEQKLRQLLDGIFVFRLSREQGA